jgi:ADP-heptose:LPS heptosyltransferase
VRDLLVVELLGGIGDLLLVLPAVHALARAHPAARVRVLTFDAAAPLLAHDPAVAEVVGVRKGTGEARDAVERELARSRPDLAVSTTRYEGIPELLEAGAGRAVTDLWRRPPEDELVDLRFLRLLLDDGLIRPADVEERVRLVLSEQERVQAQELIASLLPAAAAPPVLALVDAGMAVKRWPVERWSALVSGLVAERVPVLVPSAEDSDLVPAVREAGGVVVPPVDLRGLAGVCAAVAAGGGVAVGADTGPLRLAQAVGLRTVGLFGPTLAARYGTRPGAGTQLQGLPGCEVRRPLAIAEQECWWSARCPLSGAEPACMADLDVVAVRAAVRPFAPA